MIKMPWNRQARIEEEVRETAVQRQKALRLQEREMRKLIKTAFGRATDGEDDDKEDDNEVGLS